MRAPRAPHFLHVEQRLRMEPASVGPVDLGAIFRDAARAARPSRRKVARGAAP